MDKELAATSAAIETATARIEVCACGVAYGADLAAPLRQRCPLDIAVSLVESAALPLNKPKP